MDRTRFEQYFKDPETVDIAEMYQKFNFPVQLQIKPMATEELRARAAFIQEELNELIDAADSNDFLEVIDALVDIVVVAKGTAALMGVRWKYHWEEVHRANMMKQPGEVRPFDLVKPPGWYGPDHLRMLNLHGKSG
jgi:predicted HAD superfamily Cof-like phosphohydrolase